MRRQTPLQFLGTCCQGLGLAVVGTTVLLFFTEIGMWPLLMTTFIGITIFYAGWFLTSFTFTKPRNGHKKEKKTDRQSSLNYRSE